MSRSLVLHVKSQYFDEIGAGTKTEEYRLTTHYWKMRLTSPMLDYEKVIICRGYPSRLDLANRLERPWKGCTVKTITHPHFGPLPVEVFAITL